MCVGGSLTAGALSKHYPPIKPTNHSVRKQLGMGRKKKEVKV